MRPLDSAMRREAGRYAALINGNSPTDEDLSALLARVRNASRGHEGTFAELEIAGPDGIIAHGTNPAALGFDLHTDERSQEFLEALATRGAYVQEFGLVAWDAGAEMKYVGVPMGDGLLLLGLDREGYETEVVSQVRTITYDLPIGRGGGIVCATRNGRLVSASESILGAHVTSDVGELVAGLNEYEARHASIFGIDCRSMHADYHGFRLIALYPTSEIGLLRNISTLDIALLMAIIFSALFFIVRIEQDRIVVRRIHSLGDTLAAITDGDLTAQADVRGIAEFSELSDDINATVDALEDLIEEVRDQYAKDLDTARTIQRSALPSVFPPYPHRKEFSLFASMDAAHEVGGDFYDYFFIDAHRLVIVVADVSDKGIPASLFMMTAKTLIHSLARSGLSVDEVAVKANEQLCRNNEADMFVTVWLGVLDLRSGHMDFVDAGHTVPCVYRAEGEDAGRFTYITQRRNLFVGGMEGATYRRQELELSPGDALFVYSDGVTEATNQDEEVFGDDRLLASLDRRVGGTCEELCEGVKQDVLDFTGEAEQSDDITVLALLYRQRETSDTSHAGERVVGELNILTSEDAVDEVMRFVEKTLGKAGCADELIDRTCVVVDEVVSNVVRFAYEGKPGRLSVSLETRQGGSVVRLSFSDEGVPFDPLSNPEPDVSLPLEERPIGGLGIHLTKAYSDELSYDRVDDLNVLTVTLSRR